MRFYRVQIGENAFAVCGLNEKDETVVQAEILFEENGCEKE